MNLLRPSLLAVFFTFTIAGMASAATAPLITQQPVSATVAAGQPATFSVSALGDATLSYQWQKAGTDIETATESSYVIPSAQAADAAPYTVTITNGAGSQISAPAVLIVGTKNILHVKADAAGTNDGSSWTNAYTSLNSALTAAVDGDEIWVAAGTYKPSTVGNRDSYFAVAKVLTILGGFAGTESTASERNWNTNVTILSGDLAGNDTGPGGNQGDNSKRVMAFEGNGNAIIDGFRITGGNCPTAGQSPDSGAGIYVGPGRTATIRNCIFYWNYAVSYGGGLGAFEMAALTVEDCYFHHNAAPSNGGGGMIAWGFAYQPMPHCIVKRTLFANNSGSAAGGILLHGEITAYVDNSAFVSNTSGGGLQSGVAAGAVRGYTGTPGRFWITNCTFYANTNTRGTAGAISLSAPNDGNSMLANSIVVGSGINPVNFPTAPAYLLSDQSIAGTDNVVGTPTFVNSGNALGMDGVFGTRDDGLVLAAASPGVDSGSAAVAPLFDVTGVSRPQGAGVERGAYETFGPPQITTHPLSATVAQGAAALLQVAVSGRGPFIYQWRKDGMDIPGAIGSELSIGSVQPWHIGDYSVRVTDSEGTVVSTPATLMISGRPSGIWTGLAAYYRFAGNADDSTMFGNHGVVHGPIPAADRSLVAGASFSFDGVDDYIQIPEFPGAESNQLTVSAWVKIDRYHAPGKIRSDVIGKDGPISRQWALQIEQSGNPRAAVFTDQGEYTFDSSGNMPLSLWQHIVMVWDGAKSEVYLDGQLAGEMATLGALATGDSSIVVGGNLTMEQYFKGAMDDIRVYNRALTATDVATLFGVEDADTDGDGIRDRFETGTGSYVSPTNTGTNPAVADTDGDGLNDGQEVNVHSSNPNLKDSDSDGFEDGFEVLTGFNPASAASTPEALSVLLPAVEFRFNAANGISYRIESSTDLTDWSTIEPTITGAGMPVIRFYTTDGITRRFYRARRN